MKVTVAVFGGGIIGAFLFDMLTLRGVKTVLIEKGEDVSLGATKANSGLIHAGYNCTIGSLKAKFNVEGNKMYPKIAKRIGEKILKCGSLVVGGKGDQKKLKLLKKQGEINGVKNLEILGREKLLKLEPNLGKNICFGLYAKDAMVISPYMFDVALCEEGILNGGKVKLNFDTKSIKKTKGKYIILGTEEEIEAKYIINACGAGVNEIGTLLGEDKVNLTFVKGEYLLLDDSQRGLVSRQIFPLPTKLSKGIVIGRTIHGNIFLGPTAVPIKEYETSVSKEGIDTIKDHTLKIIPKINFKKVMKLYAGVRVKTGDDFTIRFSKKNRGYVLIAGICSPGLSCAPALAKYVIDILAHDYDLKTKKITPARRRPYTNIHNLSEEKLNALIAKNPDYGEIVCSCENISKGEILEVLRSPLPVTTTDGLKRRLRLTMGRCQGAFCYPKALKILSRFLKKREEDIHMRDSKALVTGNIKEGGIYGKN